MPPAESLKVYTPVGPEGWSSVPFVGVKSTGGVSSDMPTNAWTVSPPNMQIQPERRRQQRGRPAAAGYVAQSMPPSIDLARCCPTDTVGTVATQPSLMERINSAASRQLQRTPSRSLAPRPVSGVLLVAVERAEGLPLRAGPFQPVSERCALAV